MLRLFQHRLAKTFTLSDVSKFSAFVKTASTIVATTATLLHALKENPQIAERIDATMHKVQEAANSRNPKVQFESKLVAIETAADAVEQNFADSVEPQQWRRQATALRLRGELAWRAHRGKERTQLLKQLQDETAELLSGINNRLIELQNHPEQPRVEALPTE